MTWLDVVLGSLNNSTVIGVVLGIFELAMRIWPTAKPWSLLVPIQKVVLGVSAILSVLSTNVIGPLVTAANNTVPQPQVKK